jgi:hypothetical protein
MNAVVVEGVGCTLARGMQGARATRSPDAARGCPASRPGSCSRSASSSGDDVARHHLSALRLLRRVGVAVRFALAGAPCSPSAAGAACRSRVRSPTTARSRCKACSSTASRTSASTTPSDSFPRDWSRSATRRRRSSPESAPRSSSAPR